MIGSDKNIAFLPDLPLDLTILSCTVAELTESTVCLRGWTVLRHILGQPPDYSGLEYRVSGILSTTTLNVLKGIARYASGRLCLNGVEFQIDFVESDNLIFQLNSNTNNTNVSIKVYEYSLTNEFDLDTVEINFSREIPNGTVKLEERHLEALSRYILRQPQISTWFRRLFKSDSATNMPYNRLIQVVFNIFKFAEQGVDILHFNQISNCPRCNGTSSSQLLANPQHRYYRGLNTLAYTFRCGHQLCLGCVLTLAKTNCGVNKCYACMRDLQHIELPTDYEINWPNIKSLFIYCRDPVHQLKTDQSLSDFKTFKRSLE